MSDDGPRIEVYDELDAFNQDFVIREAEADAEEEGYRIVRYPSPAPDEGIVTSFGIFAGLLAFVVLGLTALAANPAPANGNGQGLADALAAFPLVLIFPVALIGFFIAAAKYFGCDAISAKRKNRTKKLILAAMIVPLLLILVLRTFGN